MEVDVVDGRRRKIVKKKIVYDFFINHDEYLHVKESIERAREQERLLELQDVAKRYIKRRFPVLVAQAQPFIKQIQNPDVLLELIYQLAVTTTEGDARKLLHI
jgi:hypothetical protein